MSAENLPFFKFVTGIIRNGIWAKLSPAARALYPVLLCFSDRNFKPVYPGTQTLLKLTGFKHKASLRKARKELVEQGLLTLSPGTGRENTYYQFRFDFARTALPPQGGAEMPLRGSGSSSSGGRHGGPAYNQIHISIDNHPSSQKTGHKGIKDTSAAEEEKWGFLKRRFGTEAVKLAASECRLSSIAANTTNVEKILYNNKRSSHTWSELKKDMSKHISPNSLDLICHAYVDEQDGLLIFKDNLPAHLKTLLQRLCSQVFFEPTENLATAKSRLVK